MNHCTKVTDIGLRSLSINSPCMQTLHMDGLMRIQGAGMGALAASCSTLTSLSLAGCGQFEEWTYQAMAHGSPALRHLNLNNCPKLTDEALKVWLPRRVVVGTSRSGRRLSHCSPVFPVVFPCCS